MIKYSNPRKTAVIENWPSGAHRVTARFEIERNPRSSRERATRQTWRVTIRRGDMKIEEEGCSADANPERYAELKALFA